MNAPDLQTFDILLSSGCSAFSKIIKEATGCQWSHVALAYFTFGEVKVFEATGRGVGVVSWEQSTFTPRKDFFTRMVNPGAGDVAYRRLIVERTPQMLVAMDEHIRTHAGRPYEQSKMEMLRTIFPFIGDNEEALESQFCWEAVSAALKAVGLLPADRPANTYTNNDYASDSMPWQLGAYMGPITKV